MKKSDLKAGYEITLRNGSIRVIGKNGYILDEEEYPCSSLYCYNEDLTHLGRYARLDIMSVNSVWERKEEPKVDKLLKQMFEAYREVHLHCLRNEMKNGNSRNGLEDVLSYISNLEKVCEDIKDIVK